MLLVTGITGHSGTYFVHELVEHGFRDPIRCVVREDSDHRSLSDSGLDVELLVGDLENQAFVESAMVGVDVVLHIASIFYSSIVVAAAVRAEVSRIILVHTTGVYSKYKSASSEYKDIEQMVQTMLAPTTSLVILRPTMIYGYLGDRNMSVFIRMVDKLRLFPVINRGKGLLQPVHGSDLGRAYYQVLINPDLPRDEYVLSGERPVSMREMFAMISTALGKRIVFVSVPLGLGVLAARGLRAITLGAVDYVEKVQRMGEDRAYPHEEATQDFCYTPMPLDEGIRREVADYVQDRSRR